jgi:hypothetical protein
MAGPAPKTRDWAARENVHKPKGLHMIVSGLVQVTNANKEPDLAESAERNPRTLGLDLTIKDTGKPGTAVVCWKQAQFHKEVRANEYDSVTVRWEGSQIAQVPVVDDREHSQLQDKMMQAVNLKYGSVPAKKAAPKKAAAKKAASENVVEKVADTVGTVAKAVGGWAKGAKKTLKKVLKSATGKKAAKKSVKKSAKKVVKKSAKKASRPAKKTKKVARKSVRRPARKGRR